MSTGAELAPKAYEQIRDALVTLSWASDGFYEDEAQVALDALDWLEANTLPNIAVAVPGASGAGCSSHGAPGVHSAGLAILRTRHRASSSTARVFSGVFTVGDATGLTRRGLAT